MKKIDNMPIFIIIAALLMNIALSVRNNVGFSILMIRCIGVTVVFGISSFILTQTLKNALECSKANRLAKSKDESSDKASESGKQNGKNSTINIEVPPLDDEEFMSIDNENDGEFIEMNPAMMGRHSDSMQE